MSQQRIARSRLVHSLAVVFFLLLQSFAHAESPSLKLRIALYRFDNGTGAPAYDALCQTLDRSLSLTIRQLGLYELISAPAGARDAESLRAWAEAHRADYIMYGQITQPSPGSIRCSLAIYDRAKGTSPIARESPTVKNLEAFDAADDLIAAVLQAATGRHIGFGTVNLANSGAKGSYTVSLDGIDLGTDVTSLDTILNGKHTIVIGQKRMLGPFEVARWTFDLAERQSLDLSFSIPDLTDSERSRLETLEAAIKVDWRRRGEIAKEDGRVAEYTALTSDLSFSSAMEPYQRRAKQLSGEWSIQKNRLEIERKAWQPDSELLATSIAAYVSAKSYPEPERLRSAIRDNAALLASLLELRAGLDLSRGDHQAAFSAFDSILDFSAYLPEGWKMEFAFAASALKEYLDTPVEKRDDAKMRTIFGDLIVASARFSALADLASLSPDLVVVLPSDFSSVVSYDAASSDPGPRAIKVSDAGKPIHVSCTGASQDVDLSGAAGIVYVVDGFKAFVRPSSIGPEKSSQAAFGKLSFSWLPDGATVALDGKALELMKADDGRLVSENILPNKYNLSVAVDGNANNRAIAIASGENAVDEPTSFLLDVYREREKRIKAHHSRAPAILSFSVSVASLAVGAVIYYLGDKEFNAYKNAVDISDATSARKAVGTYEDLLWISGGAAALTGLIGVWSSATLGYSEKERTSIASLDKQIAELAAFHNGGSAKK